MDCISCGKSSFVLYSNNSFMDLPIYQCEDCNLFITGNSEREIKDRSEKIYTNKYWDERQAQESLESGFADVNSQGKKRQWISQYAYCKPYIKNKKDFLEIGSGAGQTIFWFEEMGYMVTGIEPDARNVTLINQKLKRGHCISGFVEDLNIDGKFDIVWVSHVLEHLVRPDLFLEKCKHCIKDDGILFIEVPNCENEKILKSSIHENPSTFHFSKRALQIMSKRLGYSIIRCDFFSAPTIFQGAFNKIMKKYLKFMKVDPYPYYPKVISDNRRGTDIRIILKKNNH